MIQLSDHVRYKDTSYRRTWLKDPSPIFSTFCQTLEDFTITTKLIFFS